MSVRFRQCVLRAAFGAHLMRDLPREMGGHRAARRSSNLDWEAQPSRVQLDNVEKRRVKKGSARKLLKKLFTKERRFTSDLRIKPCLKRYYEFIGSRSPANFFLQVHPILVEHINFQQGEVYEVNVNGIPFCSFLELREAQISALSLSIFGSLEATILGYYVER